MEIKQLLALVTVAETRSVTRAAEMLHLVQPAVTRQIRLLEQELGVSLFERNPHGMLPTPAGEAMVAHARRVLRELEQAKAEIRPHALGVGGLVSVGLLPSTAGLLTTPLVQKLHQEYPGIRLRLRSGYSGDLQAALDRGDIDVALLYDTQSAPTLNVRALLSEQLWIVGPAGAGLAQMESVDLAEVLRHPLVLPAPGQGLRTLINALGARLKQEIVPQVETDSMAVQMELAVAAGYWTILPAGCLDGALAAGTIEAAPLAGEGLKRSIILATSREARTREAVEAVADRLWKIAGGLVESGVWLSARLPEGRS